MTGILLLGLAHGLSDAAAGFAVSQLLQVRSSNGSLLIFLYNGVAFGLQPVAGLLLDRLNQHLKGVALGLILTSIGMAAFRLDPRPGILLIGLGSGFFHAGAGAVSILNSPGRASGPGVFTAFGVIGLVIGARLSFLYSLSITPCLAFLLFVLAIAAMFIRSSSNKSTGTNELSSGFEIPIILIVIAFALRSFVWTAVDRTVDDAMNLALSIGFSAGIGKLFGGFLSDRIGWLKWTFLSISGAVVLLVFTRDHLVPLLIGVFLLQSVTGLTISWLGGALPGSPALAASLALGAAVLLGGLPFAFTNGAWFGATAILVSLAVSLAGYWLVLREKVENILVN